ncbi:MAG: hypothetical protein QUS33_01225 [Dehalococcoidia bacterium]|nr:hypothetical protein [Dehalococcoidia bacterium]
MASRLIAAALITLATILVAAGAGVGCSNQRPALAVLMDMVPEESGHFVYWGIADLNDDEDLWQVYDRFKNSSDAQQVSKLVQVLAIVKDAARGSGSDNSGTLQTPVTVLRAKFDTDYVERQLKTLEFSQSAYRNVTIWISGDGQPYRPVALLSGTMLIGNVSDLKACIDVDKEKAESLYDDPHIQVLAKELPRGIVIEVHRAAASSAESYADLVAYGKSYSKAKKDLLKVTAVYVFGDGPSAGNALQQIKEDLSLDFQDVKVSRDGNLITATARISISSFAQTIEF